MDKIFNKNFAKIVILILGLEVVSHIVTFWPQLNNLAFIIILTIFTYIAWKNPFYGLLIVIAELMIGSKGYLFAWGGEKGLSIRLGLFLILMLIWLIHKKRPDQTILQCIKNPILKWLVLFIIMVFVGISTGIAHGYPPMDVFLDANGYFYLALLLVCKDYIKDKQDLYKIIQVMLATLVATSIKTFYLLYIITHSIPFLALYSYKWVRMSGVGEITRVSLNSPFHRIFFQSHIYSLIFIFILLTIICYQLTKFGKKRYFKNKINRQTFILLSLVISSTLISFSRSFWLGIIIGSLLLFGYLGFSYIKKTNKCFWSVLNKYILATILSILMIFTVVNFPFPQQKGSFGVNDIKQRLNISNEAAISSRWNLLPELIKKIKEGPLIGRGFGTTVTYNSNDPRIKTPENPEGLYTTYTFEWGYLDTITEIGLLGLTLFLIFYLKTILLGLQNHKHLTDLDQAINLGFVIGLIVLASVHFFTPYLNHPLGLGFTVIAFMFINTFHHSKLLSHNKKTPTSNISV